MKQDAARRILYAYDGVCCHCNKKIKDYTCLIVPIFDVGEDALEDMFCPENLTCLCLNCGELRQDYMSDLDHMNIVEAREFYKNVSEWDFAKAVIYRNKVLLLKIDKYLKEKVMDNIEDISAICSKYTEIALVCMMIIDEETKCFKGNKEIVNRINKHKDDIGHFLDDVIKLENGMSTIYSMCKVFVTTTKEYIEKANIDLTARDYKSIRLDKAYYNLLSEYYDLPKDKVIWCDFTESICEKLLAITTKHRVLQKEALEIIDKYEWMLEEFKQLRDC